MAEEKALNSGKPRTSRGALSVMSSALPDSFSTSRCFNFQTALGNDSRALFSSSSTRRFKSLVIFAGRDAIRLLLASSVSSWAMSPMESGKNLIWLLETSIACQKVACEVGTIVCKHNQEGSVLRFKHFIPSDLACASQLKAVALGAYTSPGASSRSSSHTQVG